MGDSYKTYKGDDGSVTVVREGSEYGYAAREGESVGRTAAYRHNLPMADADRIGEQSASRFVASKARIEAAITSSRGRPKAGTPRENSEDRNKQRGRY